MRQRDEDEADLFLCNTKRLAISSMALKRRVSLIGKLREVLGLRTSWWWSAKIASAAPPTG